MQLPHLFTLALATFAAASPTPADEAAKSKNKDIVNDINCNGKKYTYEELAGYGSVPANARDKAGDTLGGFGSSIALDRKSWKKGKDGTYSGILFALPDRGWYVTAPSSPAPAPPRLPDTGT